MSDSLPNTRGTRISRLPGVRIYLNNYFAMFILLTGFRMRLDLKSPALWVRNNLNNYFATYTRLTRSSIHVELAPPAYVGLGIISIIILP